MEIWFSILMVLVVSCGVFGGCFQRLSLCVKCLYLNYNRTIFILDKLQTVSYQPRKLRDSTVCDVCGENCEGCDKVGARSQNG